MIKSTAKLKDATSLTVLDSEETHDGMNWNACHKLCIVPWYVDHNDNELPEMVMAGIGSEDSLHCGK